MSCCGIISVFIYTASLLVAFADTSFTQDTYLNTYQSSNQIDIETYADTSGGGYSYSPPPNNNYLPPPTSTYEPPAQPTYGPPAPVYGPPAPPTYFKPAPPLHYHSNDFWLWHKIKTKINLFTIGKIILKLLIFKKIVKFIGIICLLLFLPKLKSLLKDDTSVEEDGMESKYVETDKDMLEKRISEIYDFIITSITSFDDKEFNENN